VVLGEGVRFFGSHVGTVLLDDPDQVTQGDRVLHLHYTVNAGTPASGRLRHPTRADVRSPFC
jgi:hypothetical protein